MPLKTLKPFQPEARPVMRGWCQWEGWIRVQVYPGNHVVGFIPKGPAFLGKELHDWWWWGQQCVPVLHQTPDHQVLWSLSDVYPYCSVQLLREAVKALICTNHDWWVLIICLSTWHNGSLFMVHEWRPDGLDKVGMIRLDTLHVPSSQGNTAWALYGTLL
jgi:hypothetical protein